MKLSVIFGFLFGFGIIFTIIFVKQDPSLYWNWSALAITVGGTFSAILIFFSPHALLTSLKSFLEIFTDKEISDHKIIDTILEISKDSRQNSFKSMINKESIKQVPFLAKGLNLVADGENIDHIEEVLTRESRSFTEKNVIAERVFRIAGSFAPMFGMMGTVIGLIAMLHKIKDPAAIPAAMGLALVTTLYGLILSALVFKPISGKIRDKNNTETQKREIIILGIIAIKNGENSYKIKEKLLGSLH